MAKFIPLDILDKHFGHLSQRIDDRSVCRRNKTKIFYLEHNSQRQYLLSSDLVCVRMGVLLRKLCEKFYILLDHTEGP